MAIKRTLTIGGILVLVVASATPARAAHQPMTALVDLREFEAGVTVNLTFMVAHPPESSQTEPVRSITIRAPQAQSGGLLRVLGGVAPGWTIASTDQEIRFTGGTLHPGSAVSLGVTAEVSRPSGDRESTWTLSASRDGEHPEAVAPASSSALRASVRTVAATPAAVVAPEGATDGSITSAQDNVCLRFGLRNSGSGPASVDPSVVGAAVVAAAAHLAAEPPCSGEPASGPTTLAVGEVRSFDVRLTVGGPGSTTIRAGGTGPEVKVLESFLAVNIQPRAKLSYLAPSLTPRAVQPGSEHSFRLVVTKTALSPAVSFDLDATRLSAARCAGAPLTSPSGIPAGGFNQWLVFEGCAIGAVEDGYHGTSIAFRYVDENDAIGSGTITISPPVRVDSRPPDVRPALGTPRSVVKNGDILTFSGTISDPNPIDPAPCGSLRCPITEAVLELYGDADCHDPAGRVSVPIANAGGALQGTSAAEFAPGIRGIRLSVSVEDDAGLAATSSSPCFEVDNVPPVIISATTARVGELNVGLDLTLSECVTGSVSLADFDFLVRDVGDITCGPLGRGRISLTVVVPFADDQPETVARYAPPPVIGGRIADRVDNEMSDHAFLISDGIGPGA